MMEEALQMELRTAVVTGAGGDIGSAIVDKLTAEGILVIGLDVNIEPKIDINANRVMVKCDITDLEKLKEIFKMIEKEYKGVDIVVNCAGFASIGQITCVGTDPVSDVDIGRTIDVNIKAMIFCTRLAVQLMTTRQYHGHVININSIAGHYVPFTDQFNVYSASKYAVTAFTQALNHELASFKSTIKTTSISPGLVQTRMSSSMVKDFTKVAALQPSDVADAVLYVLNTPDHVNITELTVQPVGDIRM